MKHEKNATFLLRGKSPAPPQVLRPKGLKCQLKQLQLSSGSNCTRVVGNAQLSYDIGNFRVIVGIYSV